MARWGMVIDLDRCTACQACVVACQVENNVAPPSAEQATRGRAISWLRLVPFKESEHGTRPGLRLVPLPCMQCERPPCTKVCPVQATQIDREGLVAQVYPRCIGCRYCTTACPYTVRHFNWERPEWPEPMEEGLSPDVSVRPRGVVEKCTLLPSPPAARQGQGRRRGPASAGRRLRAGVRRDLPRGRDGLRGSRRSAQRRRAAFREPAGLPASRGARHSSEGDLPVERGIGWRESERGDSARTPTCCARSSGRGRASGSSRASCSRSRSGALFAWSTQLRRGLSVTGLNVPVYWGLYITNFVFFIGISHAGTLISAILRLAHAEWRRSITRAAEVITVLVLFFGLGCVILDLGRPDRALNVILHGNFTSPLLWDVTSISDLSDREHHLPLPAAHPGHRDPAGPLSGPALVLPRAGPRLDGHAEAAAAPGQGDRGDGGHRDPDRHQRPHGRLLGLRDDGAADVALDDLRPLLRRRRDLLRHRRDHRSRWRSSAGPTTSRRT